MRQLSILLVVVCFGYGVAAGQGQNEDSLVSVVSHKWERIHIAGEKVDNAPVPPVRSVISENKIRQRTAREQQPRGSYDPNENTIDGRSAALEKSIQDARSVKTDDINAFRFAAQIRNNSDRKIEVIFWEYRFKEFANPANTVRHQFLCSVKIKPGDKFELFANSVLAPSEVVSSESLTDSAGKLFHEKVLINGIEYADGSVLQRGGWNVDEVKASLDKAISTSWGKEVCRPL